MLINSVPAKWNPRIQNLDLSEELALTEEEQEVNNHPIQINHSMVFDPNIFLSNMESGFRIFAEEESLNEISTRRYKIPGPEPDVMTVFLSARIFHPAEFEPKIEIVMQTETNDGGVHPSWLCAFNILIGSLLCLGVRAAF
jgi:hypothetical protein